MLINYPCPECGKQTKESNLGIVFYCSSCDREWTICEINRVLYGKKEKKK